MWCMQRTLILWTLKSHLWSILTTSLTKASLLYVTCTCAHLIWNPDFLTTSGKVNWIELLGGWKIRGTITVFDWWREDKCLVGIFGNFKMEKAESLRNQDTTVQQCASGLYRVKTVCCKVILLQCKNELWSYMYLQVSGLDEQFIQASPVYYNIFVKHVEVKCSKITL